MKSISQNTQDSVLVSITDLRTAIIIFNEYDKLKSKEDIYLDLLPTYDSYVKLSDSLANIYNNITLNLSRRIELLNVAHKNEILLYKERLRNTRKEFYISTGIATVLLLLLAL